MSAYPLQDVCIFDMRARPLQRAYMDDFIKTFQQLHEDPSVSIHIPRRAEECFCDETTCTIDIQRFIRQITTYIEKHDIQRASNCIAYWRRCESNDDQNLIQSHPTIIQYRLAMIEWLRENRWVNESDTIEWRRSTCKGPIHIPHELMEEAKKTLEEEKKKSYSRMSC